jgi:2-C-methyl-D-erythritol 2,4-cyclodiphosphate synthase
MYRIGQGIDFHKLVEGRDFWLGGIHIPHHKGALGHSDADVLLHAICDALLGALSLGDIGQHFPDTDAAYKGIDSKLLLILLQAPKIRKYVDDMRAAIAAVLEIDVDDVSIKATTTEQLSFIGREEGIVATANILLQKVV